MSNDASPQLEQTSVAGTQPITAMLEHPDWLNLDAIALQKLWQAVEAVLAELPDSEQLRLVAHLILKLSERYQARAERWLSEWEEQYSEVGPIPEDSLLDGLVQRTMYLDLTGLIKQISKRKPEHSSNSVAGVVDKKKLLEVIETIEEQVAAQEKIMSLAHDEDVSGWIEAIEQWIAHRYGEKEGQSIRFSELCNDLGKANHNLTPVKLFLALLLGEFNLEQRGAFYQPDFWIIV